MLILWGFMGAGKSSIGQFLANQYGWRHLDTDKQIELTEEKSIPQIFEQYGELYFRNLETKYLEELILHRSKDEVINQAVLTTGGGMPILKKNRELMAMLGKTVYIHVSFNHIVDRLQADTTRPLWNNGMIDTMKIRYEERLPIYNRADIIINADGRTVEEIGNEIYISM
jgi:shikimate kinase